MLAKDIKIGGLYKAKVSDKLTTVRVVGIRVVRGYSSRIGGRGRADKTVYDVVNLATGRQTIFRAASKFRGEVTTVPLGGV